MLVVEPDPAIRALIVAVLRRRGHAPDAVATVEEALALQSSVRPVAVVVEPRIPGGRALIDVLSKLDGGTRPAVIVVTSDGRDPSWSETASVRAVLHKPFTIDDLVEAVTACCDER